MKPKSKQTICSSIQSFLDHIKAKWFSNRTVKEYGYSLKLFLSFCQSREVTEIRELNRKIVSDYQQYIHGSYRSKRGNPLSMGACEQKLSALKSFCSYLVNEGFLLSDPCQKLEMPKRVQPLPRGILSQDQMKELLSLPDISTALGYRDRVVLELLYGTGIRRKELIGIRLSDFDLKERRLFIAQGKGSKERWVPMPELQRSWQGTFMRQDQSL